MLTSKNKKKINFAAQIWEKYERTLSILTPKTIKKEMFNKIKLIKILPNSPFLEWYYTKNNFFLKNNEIIKNLKRKGFRGKFILPLPVPKIVSK